LLTRVLPKFKATGHRILMFCQYTTTMDVLEMFFKDSKTNYLRLDGGTKAEERGELIRLFNEPGSPIELFVLSTRAGGLGRSSPVVAPVPLFGCPLLCVAFDGRAVSFLAPCAAGARNIECRVRL
jgi:hypothetical protein